MTIYLKDAATLITTRIQTLADTAVRFRQPWTSALGQPPDDPGRAREWRRHAAVVAAYRDQHKITSDDPRQVLGPYAEPGHASHKAYWHAAESVLAARQLARLGPANGSAADNRARTQVAADIYRGLPNDERATVAELAAAMPGSMWLGGPAGPDEQAAARLAYAPQLVTVLAGRGHFTGDRHVLPERHSAADSRALRSRACTTWPDNAAQDRATGTPGFRAGGAIPRRAAPAGSVPDGFAGRRPGSRPLARQVSTSRQIGARSMSLTARRASGTNGARAGSVAGPAPRESGSAVFPTRIRSGPRVQAVK